MAITPFPISAHRTGGPDFRSPALRLASPQGTRRGSEWQAFEAQQTEFPIDSVVREPAGAAPCHFVPSCEKVAHALVGIAVNTADRDLADLLNATGILWVERPGGDRADNLEEAIACYEAALQVYSRVDTPQQWAVTQNNLGIAYRDRLCGDRADNSERAIACFQASLEVYTKADTRLNWATAQHELGTAYHERLCGDRRDNLERAIACYEAALRVYTQFDLLQEQAGLQCKLGAAYRERLCG